MDTVQSGSNMAPRCYAYRRGVAWEATCTDLDVAVFASSEADVKRSLAEAIDLHLEAVADLPDADRKAMLSRRAPWHVRFGLEVLFRTHGLRRKWRKRKSSDKMHQSFVVHPQIAVPG